LPPLVHFSPAAPLVKGAPHPVTETVDFAAAPVCCYLHGLSPRPGAQVLITAGGKPALIVGQVGQGRVACVALTCLGSPAEGQTPFWRWPAWPLLLRDLSWWVAGEDRHFD
jgi:uncharacterized membrane protein